MEENTKSIEIWNIVNSCYKLPKGEYAMKKVKENWHLSSKLKCRFGREDGPLNRHITTV